jgi:hypothetical protein
MAQRETTKLSAWKTISSIGSSPLKNLEIAARAPMRRIFFHFRGFLRFHEEPCSDDVNQDLSIGIHDAFMPFLSNWE